MNFRPSSPKVRLICAVVILRSLPLRDFVELKLMKCHKYLEVIQQDRQIKELYDGLLDHIPAALTFSHLTN